MTSINHGGKKARDVGSICRCHLSYIMPVSIYYDSLDWKIRLEFFSGGNHCLLQHLESIGSRLGFHSVSFVGIPEM